MKILILSVSILGLTLTSCQDQGSMEAQKKAQSDSTNLTNNFIGKYNITQRGVSTTSECYFTANPGGTYKREYISNYPGGRDHTEVGTWEIVKVCTKLIKDKTGMKDVVVKNEGKIRTYYVVVFDKKKWDAYILSSSGEIFECNDDIIINSKYHTSKGYYNRPMFSGCPSKRGKVNLVKMRL